MGVVYRCFDMVAEVQVAVKGLVPELANNAEDMAEIKSNFQLVSELRHRGIGGLRNLEQDADGSYYLVMDYINGTDLSHYIHNHIPSHESVFIILDSVSAALDYAHENGIIHRDIKPDNVKIDSNNEIKLLDFGIAVKIGSKRAREAGGTPEYMAPEQWYGEAQTGATDEYALAVLAYRCLYGKVPHQKIFDTISDYEKQGEAVMRDPVTFPEDTPKAVQEVFLKALAIKPPERFATCKEFVDALAIALKYRKPSHKFGMLGWITAAAVLVLAGGITSYLVKENRQAKRNVRIEEREVIRTEVVTNQSEVVKTVVDNSRINTLKKQLDDADRRAGTLAREKEELAECLAKLQRDADTLVREKAELVETISRLTLERDDLQARLEAAEASGRASHSVTSAPAASQGPASQGPVRDADTLVRESPTKKELLHHWDFNANSFLDSIGKLRASASGEVRFAAGMLLLKDEESSVILGEVLPEDAEGWTVEIWGQVPAVSDGEVDWDLGLELKRAKVYHYVRTGLKMADGTWQYTYRTKSADGSVAGSEWTDDGTGTERVKTGLTLKGGTLTNATRFNEVRIWNFAFTEEDFHKSDLRGPDRAPKF